MSKVESKVLILLNLKLKIIANVKIHTSYVGYIIDYVHYQYVPH
jgi:hypothetical protein